MKKKRWLRYRGPKSLEWVPFNIGHITFDGEAFVFRKVRYTTMHLRNVLRPGVKVGAGSFNRGQGLRHQPESICQDQHGKECSLSRLVGPQVHAVLSGDYARRHVSSGARGLHLPSLLAVRLPTRFRKVLQILE